MRAAVMTAIAAPAHLPYARPMPGAALTLSPHGFVLQPDMAPGGGILYPSPCLPLGKPLAFIGVAARRRAHPRFGTTIRREDSMRKTALVLGLFASLAALP